LPVLFTLKDLTVRRGVHLGSLARLPFKAKGLEEQYSLREAIDVLLDEWKELKSDVFINVITMNIVEPSMTLALHIEQ